MSSPSPHRFSTICLRISLAAGLVAGFAWGAAGRLWAADDADTVQALVASLASPNPEHRSIALYRLGVTGSLAAPALPAIVATLADPAPVVRITALDTLSRLRLQPDAWLPQAVRAAADGDPAVRAAALEAIARVPSNLPEALRAAVAAAADPEPVVRIAAAHVLAGARNLKDAPDLAAATLAALVKQLDDPVVYVRVAAAGSLPFAGAEPAELLKIVLKAANDADHRVRVHGVGRLGGFKGEGAALETLTARLRDADWSVRQRAVEALSAHEGPQVLALVAAAAKDGDENIRATAVEGLGRYLAREGGYKVLGDALRDGSSDVRYRACRVALAAGPAAAVLVSDLLRLLDDRSWLVRATAAEALGRIGPPAASAAVKLGQLHSDDWNAGVRQQATAAQFKLQAAAGN